MGLVLLFQCAAPIRLPYVGKPVSFLYSCWTCAFYCFEYKWGLDGLTLNQQLVFVEERWAYFLGFGTPVTVATFFFPQFLGLGVYALVFPMVCVHGQERDCVCVCTRGVIQHIPRFLFE